MTDAERAGIGERLAAWKMRKDENDAERDKAVRDAFRAGFTKQEIHELTGIARTTIDRILRPVGSADQLDGVMRRMAGMPPREGGE